MLYLTNFYLSKDGKPRIIGYIKINGSNVKIMEAQNMYDVRHFVKREGFINFKYETPMSGRLCILKWVKEW